MRSITFIILFLPTLLAFPLSLGAQLSNDECSGATFIADVTDYCSEVGEFSNAGASQSGIPQPSCFPQNAAGNDVWFAFQASATGVSIRVVGGTRFNAGGSLRTPQLALYQGSCNNPVLLECISDGFAANFVEVISGPLNVGETYFIRVDARNGETGNFQLCISSFNLLDDPVSDCPSAVLLCDKSPITVPSLIGAGADPNEIDGSPCTPGANGSCDYEELNSVWYKWICDDPGTLTFTINPLNPVDDLDFWVYELPNGFDDCTDKLPLRCMASGENVGEPFTQWQRCTGATGMRENEPDEFENCGCSSGDNNFISAINMEAGKAYALAILNFSSSGSGFSISWGGTGTFVGPDVDFTIDPELDNQCDVDTLFFADNSTSGIGTITSYEWNFGSGATPRLRSVQGPHEVVYNSFGEKNIVLRITTDAGCVVTHIEQVYIEPCCDPADALMVDVLDLQDPECPETPSGSFTVGGSGGNPLYQYSLDGSNFQPITTYTGLFSGEYMVWIQDIKGCRDSTDLVLVEPPPFAVDAGPDQTINLGDETSLRATVLADFPTFFLEWTGDSTLSCFDCLDPTVFPSGNTTYSVTAINPAGCTATDSVTIFVQIIRPVFIPSAFSPNDDGINDFFPVFAGKQARVVRRMLIFDRWGNQVYEGTDLPLNEETGGWDGSFNGKKMDPAVFTYYIEIEFIDNVVLPYSGDVTLFR